MPDIVTPEVGRIHWNDLLREFRVCASIELDTPLGIKPHAEQCATFGDLVSAINFIIKVFTTVGSAEPGNKLTAPVGDPTELVATITAANLLTQVVPTLPPVPDGNTGSQEGLNPIVADYGITTP